MAVKLPTFRLLPAAGAKSRVFFLLFLLAVAAVGVYFLVQYLGGDNTATGASRIAAAPANLQSIPGGKSSPEYSRAVMAANAEASRVAQMTGESAVPTLMNVPVVQPVYRPQQNCTVLCPDVSKETIKDKLNDLVKAGKISRKVADMLAALAGRNVSVDEYAAALNELVRQGKLTPAQARALLEKYRKQHMDALVGKSALVMDGMIRGGRLSLEEANRLLALQKNGISAGAYSAALKREVADGRLSAEAAAELLGQYADQQIKEAASQGAFRLKQVERQGAITSGVAESLADLQARNVPFSQYEAAIRKMIAEGKLTPATAEQLINEYKNQRARTGSADALSALIKQQEALAASCVLDQVGQGGLTRSDADSLVTLQQRDITRHDWQSTVMGLQQAGKFTTAMAQTLIGCYQKLADLREESARLQRMQADNASQAAYANALKQAVQAGVLDPKAAADLMQEYAAMVTPAGAITTAATALPGAEDFARLQQRVQQNVSPGARTGQNATAQFAAVAAEANAKAAEERAARIQQRQAAMMSQAQTLLTAWQQPATITHVAGQAVSGTKKASKAPVATGTPTAGAGAETTGAAAASAGPPLIKTGAILFAVLDTAVDSDYPDTPVMATIVQGQFRGARLIGKLFLAQGQDRVSLNFSLMDSDNWPKTKSVSAFALDPDTARTVMATSVDHHYLMRYGALFAASFLTGYSAAITNAGNSTTGIFGTSVTRSALSPGNKLAVGLGQVGTALTSVVQGYTNTPATVRIKSGVAVAIMFTADVTG